MKVIVCFLLFLCNFIVLKTKAQCTTLGQTPATAFPVCGEDEFDQENVPICTNGNLFVPGCSGRDGIRYEDKNPFWYKFTCFAAGTLGFRITPLEPADDYDWQLFDVTGQNPNAVFTNNNLVIASNWSARPNDTGTSGNANNQHVCATTNNYNGPNFSRYPNLILGHEYLLMISHFEDSQEGYSLSFGGGTASITDPLLPKLLSASAPCDGTEIRIRTNKKMKCNSLAADGSDFTVIAPNGTLIIPTSATTVQCSTGFDLDSVSIFLASALTPGTYKVKAKNGTDGNTLKDNCDRLVSVGDSVTFTVFPLLPTPMDSLTTPKCVPQTLELVFRKRIKCSSIDPAGGDFFITGSYPINITGATGNCINGVADKIILQLSSPPLVNGNFTVNLRTGPDGNTLLDECDVQTPLPDDVTFVIKDTVNADFGKTIEYTCAINTVRYTHSGANAVSTWQWTFGSAPKNATQNPVITYTNFEPKTTTLIVSNGVCSDTSKQQIIFANYLKADFEVTTLICPNKKVDFKNKSIGTITNWKWTFGNGNMSTQKNPLPQLYVPLVASDYNSSPELIIQNDFGCFDTITKPVQVLYSCFIAVPSAFTPNGDGLNDFLYPLKAYKSTNLNFSIYNRLGQRVFYSNSWLNKWDGKLKGIPQDPGTYVWTLDYFNSEEGKRVVEKGTSILIR
ncbi:MAG: gliding motility-associated C-terminal domain-containing protein [Ferruginibacter sp.]